MTRTACSWLLRAWLAVLGLGSAPALAQEDTALGFERTPPRLSFTDGEVSYWRPGSSDWADARVNTALAAGDQLSTAPGANVELQVGARAWLRSGELSELGLTSLEPDFLQLKLTIGTAALDLRELASGQTFEIDTPNAAFTIERPGFYRVEVADDATTFTTRRGGRATIATQGGLPTAIETNERLVVTGVESPVLISQGAPELDDWDRWNYSRSDQQAEPASARYVPAGVYGADDLDRHGTWQQAPTYGAVWVPRVAVGWTPYSTGSWVAHPYYGWTWVDDAPWGWAPFHYGRWVYVGNYWAWSPGPRVVRPYYSPALVAFYGGSNFSVGVSFGGAPYAGWVALGWGEPVVPWWGPRGCRGQVRWAGWGGPRYVNNVQINHYTTVHAKDIHRYSHWDRKGAFVAVDRERFGRGHVRDARVSRFDRSQFRPVGGRELGAQPERTRHASADRRGDGRSRDLNERRVVTRRDTLEPGMRDPSRGRTREAERGAEAGGRNAARGANERRLQQDREARARRDAPPPTRMARADTSQRRRSVSERAPASRGDAAGAARERGRGRGQERAGASRAPEAPAARSREARRPDPARAIERRSPRDGASERRAPAAPRESRASAPRADPRERRALEPRAGNRERREAPRARESSPERAPRQVRERAPRAEPPREPARAERREQPQRREPSQDRSLERAPRSERAPAAREQRQPRESGGGNERGRRGGSRGDGGRGSQRRQG